MLQRVHRKKMGMKVNVHDRRRTSRQPMIHGPDSLFYTSIAIARTSAIRLGSDVYRHLFAKM